MTYEESINYLNKTAGFAKKSPINNIEYLLECLGNPQDSLRLIHVAGTNGKGSTCMFLEALLKEKGMRTGVFSSPHLLCVNERIRINGENIENQLFSEVFKEVSEAVKKAIGDGRQHPSFFEMLFLMAMVSFQKEKLDYCIVETGMGGRYDATNMILPKVSILTTISMDHMEFLGESLDKIAYHKAGIIKEGVPVISAKQEKQCMRVIQEEAEKKNAPLEILSEDNLNFIEKYGKYIDFLNSSAYDKKRVTGKNVAGKFQRENLALALKAAECILGTFEEPVIFHALEKIRMPGRMEEVLPGVYVDVAHNIQGIEAFCATVEEHFKGRKRIIFGASHKNEEDHMRHILESMNGLESFQTISINGRVVDEKEFQNAFEEMIRVKDKETICFVVGSFYLVGITKQYISRRKEYVKF
ncbi:MULTISPECIES: bifunctional folylpolyglutamate synthase/dihydrofolate synthase [Anaerostipes]|uniref:bifunctional folylpolyglutamate synthase/dihydrofolate synthase n=1 Tax=Anaerostipes TaxID=207244 RepID=UPI0009518A4F|nr:MULTISPECIES: Mur ligase family protein [unclassified Anaerostipes]MCI5623739.1 Mur ligase family protein [Anaerostipes sp.]OLR58901.1 folylpolyglutamate synthase/dihydrofolate synthase [Anaerostipes sp. 494a]